LQPAAKTHFLVRLNSVFSTSFTLPVMEIFVICCEWNSIYISRRACIDIISAPQPSQKLFLKRVTFA
jgi:hypothetical protein